jgi:hypothetical protein
MKVDQLTRVFEKAILMMVYGLPTFAVHGTNTSMNNNENKGPY